MSGDSGDSSSDFSAKPSCSRRISTRRSKNNASAAATASSSSSSAATNAMHGGCGGGKKKRRIVMRIEFDDDSEDSMTSGSSSGQSDYCNRKVRNVSKANRTTKRNSAAAAADEEDDDIKPCSSRKLRGKLGKKTNFVFSNDESNSGDDDVPAGSNRKVRRNRQRLLVDDDDDEDDIDGPGCSRDTREIARTLRHQKKLGSSDDDDDDEPGVAAPSTSTSQPNPDEENGFNSDSSSNELLEKCPICLLTFRAQEIGSPATCEHIFCANCIEAWSKNVQTCPIDRIEFDRIIVRESYESRKLVREINVCKESGGKPNLDLSEEELTQCEVCSRTDREDVMLLCDSCNHGYHIDCLNPSLPDVPEGSWYCDNCFDTEDEDSDLADDLNVLYEDIRDMGIPETRLRVTEVHQPRILRTRQNERIRATILSRTRSSARNQSADVAAPSSSRTASASRSARTLQNSARTARTTKTRRRRRRRARQRTYVVEYDLNNYDEKFAIKTTKKVIRRRRRRRTQRTARSCRAEGSGGRMTASKRLAEQLGITATDREARSAVSSQNFSLFGNANDLEYFSDSDDGDRLQSEVEIETGGGGTAVQTSVRISNFRTHHRSKKGLLSRLERAQPSSAPDLLSNIMDMQDRWHNASRHLDAVRIGQDGSLNLPPPSAEGGSPAVNPSPTVAPETQPSSAVNSNEITQAPMYPRGGGGNNRNFSSGGGNSGGGGGNYNNRYNNQSNYRGGGGGGGNSGGGQYRNSFGSSSGTGSGSTGGTSGNLFNMVGRGNFSFSSQSNDNNSNNTGNNNTPNNRNNRFNNQRNNNNNNRNQRNSLPFGNNQSNDDNLASSNVSQSPLQQRQNIPIQPTQQGQFQHQLTPSVAPSLLTMPPIQPPVGLYTSLPPPTSGLPPPPLYGPPTMQIPPLMSQPPPIMPMRPLPAPPSFNSSLLQLTADYGNDDDDDSNCPNFSVYSMESLQVAKSDINAAAESKGDTPKEDDENEDLVQLSDDDETMATGNDEIPLPPSVENAEDSAKNKDNDLYEPDQPTVETDDESANDDQNKDQGDDEEESQKSPPENDMELDSEDTVSPPTSSKKPAEEADAKNSTADGAADDERNLLDIKLPTEGTKVKRAPRKGVLELYDDSDWEELNMERPTVRGQTPPQLENETHEKDVENHNDEDEGEEKEEGHTPDHSTPLANKEKSSDEEGDKEQDRSYTPCLDEKNDDIDDEENNDDGARTPELAGPSTANLNTSKDANTSDQAAGIAGMETELISEDDDADKRDKRKRSKSGKDKEQFKKVSKNQKDRNYRSDKPHEDRSKSRRRRSRSRTNDKENQGMSRRRYQRGGGRFKRREMPRYNVRNIVNQQRTFKDRYGRDTSRPARSTSRTRRRRSFSRSNSRSKSRSRSSSSSGNKRVRRSFSISPSPPRFVGNRRQSVSPPRRRSHSPVRNRSPIRRQSRTPLRMRSRSNSPTRRFKHTKGKRAPGKRSLSPPVNRARSLSRFTPRLSRSRTPPRHKGKRPKDRKKKKAKKRQASPSPPPDNGRGTPPRRVSRRRDSMPPNKRKRHHTPKANSPVVDQGWSPSPSPARQYGHDNISWTPPLMSPAGISRLRRNDEFNEFSITSKPPKEKKKREKKKKKAEKRRTEISRKEKRRRNPSGTAPSKEVFASGNNILVSVSFNKDGNQPQQTTVVTLPPTREEVLASIRGRSKDRQNDTQNKKKKKKGTERKRKKLDTKPVAIIDLERSPFQITQEQTDIIVLTDSEGGGHDDENLNVSRESANDMTEMDHHHVREGSSHRTVNSDKTPPLERLETIMEESYENAIQQQGPKTPPEPPGGIKFNLINKSKAKAIRNALHDDAELESDEHHDEERQEERDSLTQNSNKIGPNTPPESGPCSPDVYDPFDPTKSPSLSPRSPTPPLDMSHDSVPDNDVPSKHSTEDLRSGMTASSGTSAADKNALNPVDLVMALMNNKANTSQDSVNKSDSQYNSGPVVVSLLDENDKPEENISTMGITVLSNVILSSGKTQHIPSISSPPLSKASSNKQQPKITNILSGLPGLRHNGDDAMNDIESPYSPGSADYEDLFEPPPDTNGGTKRRRDKRSKAAAGGDVFSDLFGSSTPPPTGAAHLRLPRKYKAAHTATKNKHKMIVKVGKLPGNNNDEHVKVYDDLPNSAVELQVKDKFLRKLNRQERVVEEVKTILKPKFNKKQITKDDYKEIMRRAVPKICHSKSGEINPKKIQNLIDAYVKKFRQKHKKLNIPNTGQVSSAVKCAAYLKKL